MKAKQYIFHLPHACFRCRKVFKFADHLHERDRAMRLSRRISGRRPMRAFQAPKHVCPQCRGEVMMMGRAFRVPKMNDPESWQGVELLVAAGFRFFGYRTGPLPSGIKAVRRFVAQHRLQPAGLRLAERIKAGKAHVARYT